MTTEDVTPKPQRKPKKQGAKQQSLIRDSAPMTLEQFRSYLRGIMFVGGDGWHPNLQQWEDIVFMINNLIDSPRPPVQQQVVEQPMYEAPYSPQYYTPPQQTNFVADSGLAQPSDDSTYQSPFV